MKNKYYYLVDLGYDGVCVTEYDTKPEAQQAWLVDTPNQGDSTLIVARAIIYGRVIKESKEQFLWR